MQTNMQTNKPTQQPADSVLTPEGYQRVLKVIEIARLVREAVKPEQFGLVFREAVTRGFAKPSTLFSETEEDLG